MSTVDDGLYQWGGVPVGSNTMTEMFAGNVWFVDNVNGLAGNSGESPTQALSTITLGVAAAAAGDVIYVRGTGTDYDEAVTLSLDRVTLIGVGNTPRQVGWNSDADTTCLTITGRYFRVSGFGFRPDGATTGYAINLADDTTSNNYSYDTVIDNNYFRSTGTTCKAHILANGCPENVKILNNIFTWGNYAINNDTFQSKPARGWEVRGNHFLSTLTTGVRLSSARCVFVDNTFAGPGGLNTFGVSSNAALGANQFLNNNFGGTFDFATGKYKFNATDDFTGNYTNVGSGTYSSTEGQVMAVPA